LLADGCPADNLFKPISQLQGSTARVHGSWAPDHYTAFRTLDTIPQEQIIGRQIWWFRKPNDEAWVGEFSSRGLRNHQIWRPTISLYRVLPKVMCLGIWPVVNPMRRPLQL
jgi:hypothetical protein